MINAINAVLALAPALVAAVTVQDVTVEVGDGTVLAHHDVSFDDDGVVTAVVATGGPVAGAVVDGRGKVLSPGLVATGSQLGLFEVGLEPSSDDEHLNGAATPGFRAADGYNPLSPHITVDREEGVLTAVLAPGQSKLLAGQAFVVDLAEGEDALPDGGKPVALYGAFDGGTAEAWGGSRAGLLLALREILDDARFYRAHAAAFDKGESRELKLSPTHLKALYPLLDGKVPLVVKVDRAADIRALLAFAEEQRLKLVVEGGVEAWMVAAALRAQSVPVIVHPSWCGVVSLDALHARDDLAKLLFDAGVTVVVASWDSQNGTTRVRQEAGLAVQSGLAHAEAIKAITSTPATLFGGGPLAGRVKKGAVANLVLWSGDPLEALTVSERLWVHGSEITTPSRQKQLAQKYKPKK